MAWLSSVSQLDLIKNYSTSIFPQSPMGEWLKRFDVNRRVSKWTFVCHIRDSDNSVFHLVPGDKSMLHTFHTRNEVNFNLKAFIVKFELVKFDDSLGTMSTAGGIRFGETISLMGRCSHSIPTFYCLVALRFVGTDKHYQWLPVSLESKPFSRQLCAGKTHINRNPLFDALPFSNAFQQFKHFNHVNGMTGSLLRLVFFFFFISPTKDFAKKWGKRSSLAFEVSLRSHAGCWKVEGKNSPQSNQQAFC